MLRLAILTSSLLFAGSAFGAEAYPSDRAFLSWTAPETYTDGTPISAPISYRVYVYGVQHGTTSDRSMVVTGLLSGLQCFTVTAVVENVESAPSGELCKFIRPAAPTDGAIEAPSDGAIEEI